MKFPAFSYAAPSSLAQAIGLLAGDEDARPLAGGQTLLPLLALRLAAPQLVVDLGKIDTLATIEASDGMVRIGAMVTHDRNARSAENRAHIPLLTQAVHHVAHQAVRNRGTIGGSIANADSAAEMPVVAVALGATMVIEGTDGRRMVPAADFFQGHYETSLQQGDLLVRIDIPFSKGTWVFDEVARRPGDFALVMVAVGLQVRDEKCQAARIVLGSVSDRPLRSLEAEEFLTGKGMTPQVAAEAARIAMSNLKSRGDIHASADYRRSVAGVLIQRSLLRAAEGEGT
jgi:CO/xanthine dehydrogenase FAD-binding subunit